MKAIADLNSACRQSKKEIVLKSCTGSGKTIILTHFIDRFIKENPKMCFVWFTPGKGNLEDQSKAKMDFAPFLELWYSGATKLRPSSKTCGRYSSMNFWEKWN